MTAVPNIAYIIGNLTADPEIRAVGNDTVANFRVASTGTTFNRETGKYEDKDAVFYQLSAWRRDAENVRDTLKKGDRIVAIAEAKPNSYEKDGVTINTVQYDVKEIAVSLAFASATITRNGKGQSSAPAQAPAAPAQAAAPAAAPAPAAAAPVAQPVYAGGDDDFS